MGAGEVGFSLASSLSNSDCDVTVIESDPEVVHKLEDELDVKVFQGNGSSAKTLEDAGVRKCRFFLSVTSDDRSNLIACSLAKALGKNIFTLARIHDQTYNDNTILNYQSHFGIDYLFNPEALCAVELAKIIRNPGRVAVENFARGKIEVQTVKISRKSPFLGKSLYDIKLDRTIRVGYILRKGKTVLPRAETVFEQDDLVVLFGESSSLYEQRRKFNPEKQTDSIKVVIFGGSEIAIGLIRMLSNPRFKIRIIEENKTSCERLAEQFPQVTVIQGDGRAKRLLEEEQIGKADYFIGCTRWDEDNVMACLQAKKIGVEHTLLVISKPDYESILIDLKERLGIDEIVSPRAATGNEVLRLITDAPYTQLAEIPDSEGVILECAIPFNSVHQEVKLKDLHLPKGTLFVALMREFEVMVPGAEDFIKSGDRVVFITDQSLIEEVVMQLTRAKDSD